MIKSPTINSVHGRILTVTGTDPAADTEISVTVPDRRRWIVHSLNFLLTTDANVANRYIKLIIDNGAVLLFQFFISQVQVASRGYRYSFANINVSETFVDPTLFHPFPLLPLFSGCRILTLTTDLQVGDNFSAPVLLVEEFIDPTS